MAQQSAVCRQLNDEGKAKKRNKNASEKERRPRMGATSYICHSVSVVVLDVTMVVIHLLTMFMPTVHFLCPLAEQYLYICAHVPQPWVYVFLINNTHSHTRRMDVV